MVSTLGKKQHAKRRPGVVCRHLSHLSRQGEATDATASAVIVHLVLRQRLLLRLLQRRLRPHVPHVAPVLRVWLLLLLWGLLRRHGPAVPPVWLHAH